MAKARTRRPQTRRPAPARSRRPAAKSTTRTQRVGQSSRKALSPHKGDIQGVFLVVFAMVLALGIWFEDGGRLGVFMALLFRGLFGYGAYAVPLLVGGLALALFWRPAAKDDMVAGRVTIGLLAMLVGGLGLLHLWKGAPPASSTPAVLQESGGLVGGILPPPPGVLERVDPGGAPPKRRGRKKAEPLPEPDPDDTIEVVVGKPVPDGATD